MNDGVKQAAKEAGLNKNQSALLQIAAQPTLEAQLAKLADIAARQAAGRRTTTPAERWNATVRAFERLTEDHKMMFCAKLIEAGYSPENSE